MVAVIGDIHGCYYTMLELIEEVRKKYSDIPLYCVGDLIDRGNFSFQVVEHFNKENIQFTPGNHDYMFYYFIKHPSTQMGSSWIYNGFESTISSYNDRFDKIAEHLDFIKDSPLIINTEDCFISHAGISKEIRKKLPKDIFKDIEETHSVIRREVENLSGVLWTREELINIGKLQLVGHTRHYEVNHLEKNNVAYIDTSAFTGNKLTAVIVDKNKIVDTLSVQTKDKDIE